MLRSVPIVAPKVAVRGSQPRRMIAVCDSKSPVDKIADKLEEKVSPIIDQMNENTGLKDKAGPAPGEVKSLNKDKVQEAQEVFSFQGLLPEIINGRAAMFAMLAAFGAEIATRQPVIEQVKTAANGSIFLAFATIIVASFIPVAGGADLDRNGAGPFTQRAAVYNGRLAMLSFVALLIVEGFKGGPGLVF